MTKKAHELKFISIINRDGSGTNPVSESLIDCMLNNPFAKREDFQVFRLSMSNQTYIAIGFNSFVVKLK